MFDSQVPAGTEAKEKKMDTKFTQGPWTIGTGSFPSDVENHAVVAGCEVIAKVTPTMRYSNPQESLANATLMAAAPDMYAALQSAIEGCGCTLRQRESGHLVDCYAPAAIAALEKARGEKS